MITADFVYKFATVIDFENFALLTTFPSIDCRIVSPTASALSGFDFELPASPVMMHLI